MTDASRDGWTTGEAYEHYMGRWSRSLGQTFLGWLRPEPARHWLEVGCGTGALTSSIAALGKPASVVACDPSAPFVEHARRALPDPRLSFVVMAPGESPTRDGGFDFVVSGLVLNFIPDAQGALQSMRERTRPGGTVAAYVWDYTGGLEFLRYFWEAAVALDPSAAPLDEARRFESCGPANLTTLFRNAGFEEVELGGLEVATPFADFADYWRPFLGGTGPAPSYVAQLEPARRDLLEARLRSLLPVSSDGRISLQARASAVRGVAP